MQHKIEPEVYIENTLNSETNDDLRLEKEEMFKSFNEFETNCPEENILLKEMFMRTYRIGFMHGTIANARVNNV